MIYIIYHIIFTCYFNRHRYKVYMLDLTSLLRTQSLIEDVDKNNLQNYENKFSWSVYVEIGTESGNNSWKL